MANPPLPAPTTAIPPMPTSTPSPLIRMPHPWRRVLKFFGIAPMGEVREALQRLDAAVGAVWRDQQAVAQAQGQTAGSVRQQLGALTTMSQNLSIALDAADRLAFYEQQSGIIQTLRVKCDRTRAEIQATASARVAAEQQARVDQANVQQAAEAASKIDSAVVGAIGAIPGAPVVGGETGPAPA